MKNYKKCKLGVIILNYGNPSNTINLIHYLRKIIIIKKIIIIDNFSNIINSNILKKEVKKINSVKILLKLKKKNTGYADANNFGLDKCFRTFKLNYALVLNPDIKILNFIDPKIFENKINYKKKIIFTGIIQEKKKIHSLFKFNQIFLSSNKYTYKTSNQKLPIHCSGSCIGFTKAFWFSEGGFSTDYFLYYEELDLIYRFFKKYNKYPKLISIDSLKIKHFQNQTMGSNKIERSYTVDYWSSRSRLIFLIKNKPIFLIFGIFYNLTKALLKLIELKFTNATRILIGTIDGLNKF